MTTDTAIVERVASSPEELAFLARIAAQPADDVARLIYADWLEERGDSRGQVLRSCVEACKTNAAFSLEGVAPAWADLTGLTLSAMILKSGLRDWRSNLLAVARPALRLDAPKAVMNDPPPPPPSLGTTRLGGDPDLPVGTSFPTAADGVPLHFLGQFDLADFRGTVGGLAFPEDGLLSIFRPQSDGKNCYPTTADCPRLVRLTPRGSPLARLPRPANLTDDPAPFRQGLRLVESLRLPAGFRHWGVPLSWEQASQLDEIFPTNLGGTAYHLLGHVTHGNTGEEPLQDRPDWVQLILVPYFEGPDFGVSDMSLSYQLPAADLKAGRFDRLEATFG